MCCCESDAGRIGGGVAAVVAIGLLLLVILLPLSLQRVSFDEAALVYNTATKEVGTTILREGLHDVGPSSELLILKTTQRSIFLDNTIMLSKDGIEMNVDVDVFFTVQISDIFRIFTRFETQNGHDAYLSRVCRVACLEVASTFLAREFVDARQVVQRAMQNAIQSRFVTYDTDATIETLNLRNIDFPRNIVVALNETTIASADVSRAESERSSQLQQANTRFVVAKSQADLVVINANRDSKVLVQVAKQQVVGLRALWQNRIATFTNISSALARGGDFFVESYVRNLVLQSTGANVDKTLLL